MISSGPKRILIVDDDADLVRALKDALTSFLRCEVDTSHLPQEAFEMALINEYHLFLFDFSMPMIDGAMLYFLLGKVYNHDKPRPRVLPPLILVTAKGDEERAQDLLRQPGVVGLIPKPFQINRLMGKIAASVPGMEMRASA